MEDTTIHKICKEPGCGRPFSISPEEQQWLKERELKPFERCKERG